MKKALILIALVLVLAQANAACLKLENAGYIIKKMEIPEGYEVLKSKNIKINWYLWNDRESLTEVGNYYYWKIRGIRQGLYPRVKVEQIGCILVHKDVEIVIMWIWWEDGKRYLKFRAGKAGDVMGVVNMEDGIPPVQTAPVPLAPFPNPPARTPPTTPGWTAMGSWTSSNSRIVKSKAPTYPSTTGRVYYQRVSYNNYRSIPNRNPAANTKTTSNKYNFFRRIV